MIGAEQFADADAESPPDFILVARPDAAPGGANLPLAAAFKQPLLFHVIREDGVRMVAEVQRAGHVDAALRELLDFFEESRRVNDNAVTDNRNDIRPDDTGWQQRELEALTVDDDGVSGVLALLVLVHDDVEAVAKKIDDLPLRFIAPLQADHARTGHRFKPPRCEFCGVNQPVSR